MLENSILFIGIGTNHYKVNEIEEVNNNLASVRTHYGPDSCFYKAYRNIYAFGVTDVYILNLDAWEDLKEHENLLKDLGFDYICPLDLYLNDSYYDDFYQKTLFYSQLLLMLLHRTISTVIMTGTHATAYEDLDSFLKEERNRIEAATIRFANLKRENIIYVANNLNDYEYANAVLAAVLSLTDYGEYPNASFGEAYFDIDYSDVTNRLVYFKNNELTGTTIENLVNFSDDYTMRLVPVYKIIKYFYYHKPDHEQFIGKTYTEYRKLKIQEKLEEFLDNLVDWIIYKYQILSIIDVSTEIGTVDVILRYLIWPKFTTEAYKMEMNL